VNATQAERLRAVELVCREGWSVADAAKAVGRAARSVRLWVQKSHSGRRRSALKTRKAPGAVPKLTKAQQRELLKLLEDGPEAAGFSGQLWTAPRIGELIQRTFGVTYHERYLPTLLRSFGWSPQKPKRKAAERNEAVIAHWIRCDWPRVKKKPAGSKRPSYSSTKRPS